MKYLVMIESFYPSFSRQERKIADFVKQEGENISYMSLQEISKKIKVGEATIVRFVKKLGFKGIQEFKLTVAKENIGIIKKTPNNYLENIEQNINMTVMDTKKIIDIKKIDKAVEFINTSKNIYIYGVGSSGVAAMELQNRLMRYGKPSFLVVDTHFQIMQSSVMQEDDLVIAISLSGETKELIYSLNLAKENKAKIITITNHILSPIAKMAQVVLLTAGKETPLDGGSLIAKISQLYVIDVLCTGYALSVEEFSNLNKTKTAEAIAEY